MLTKRRRKLPGLGDWAYFHSFKTFIGYESYRSICPADYAYYKEKDEYFYTIKGHAARRMTGRILGALMRWGFRLIIKE